jgi:hypothetical protein
MGEYKLATARMKWKKSEVPHDSVQAPAPCLPANPSAVVYSPWTMTLAFSENTKVVDRQRPNRIWRMRTASVVNHVKSGKKLLVGETVELAGYKDQMQLSL